jgi:hypothetical protein
VVRTRLDLKEHSALCCCYRRSISAVYIGYKRADQGALIFLKATYVLFVFGFTAFLGVFIKGSKTNTKNVLKQSHVKNKL